MSLEEDQAALRRTLDAEYRLHHFLLKNKLMFMYVGGRYTEDRFISMFDDQPDGSTLINEEYDGLLRAIVACVLSPINEPPKTLHEER